MQSKQDWFHKTVYRFTGDFIYTSKPRRKQLRAGVCQLKHGEQNKHIAGIEIFKTYTDNNRQKFLSENTVYKVS